MVTKRDNILITMTTRQLLAKVPSGLSTTERDPNKTNIAKLISFQLKPRQLVGPSKTIICDNKSEESLFRYVVQ